MKQSGKVMPVSNKYVKAVIALWVDNEEELLFYLKKYPEVYNVGSPDTSKFIEGATYVTLNKIRYDLILVEIDKLYYSGLLDGEKTGCYRKLLKGTEDDYFFSKTIISLLREKRLNI